MERNSVIDRIISEQTDETFKPVKSRLIIRILVISTAAIYIVETLVMLLLSYFWEIPQPFDLLLDGLILIVVLSPLNYYFIVRPMAQEIEKHHQTYAELGKSYQILERFFQSKIS